MDETQRDARTAMEGILSDQEPEPTSDSIRQVEQATSATMSQRETDMDVEATPCPTMPERETDIEVEPTTSAAVLETEVVSSETPDAVVDDTPFLSPEDLAAFGLDGAAEWVQRFSSELRSMPSSSGSQAAAQLLLRLVQNVISNPSEAKFRRIRAENPKIRSTLFVAGADTESLLRRLGFESINEGGERVFLLRDACLDVVRLQLGKDLLEQHLSRSVAGVA
jgi:hypothetical protein